MTPGRISSLSFTRASRSVMVSVSVSLSYSAFMRRLHISRTSMFCKVSPPSVQYLSPPLRREQHLSLKNRIEISPHENAASPLSRHNGIRPRDGPFHFVLLHLAFGCFLPRVS